ncbi:MAG: M48 family metallopeptidase, partial [Oligoflexales bacterium]|nr:M48 family metallopeptidase [Oligoflexales bacterium]
MDFFESQDRARSKTRFLVLFIVLSAILTISALTIALICLFPGIYGLKGEILFNYGDLAFPKWISGICRGIDRSKFYTTVVTISLVMILASLIKTQEIITESCNYVTKALKAREIFSDTKDLAEKTLINIAEEMSLASGIFVPRIYVLDNEKSLNALVAGIDIKDTVIIVTRGLLLNLERDQLQGVIAHEFGHIVHGDMIINLRLTGLLHGILFFKHIGMRILDRRIEMRGKGGNPFGMVAIAFIIIGSIGYLFASIIKAAVSRQREFLADASAVQFTRNPNGIASALDKIDNVGSSLVSPRASEFSHFFFARGIFSFLGELFDTHPSISERIRRIFPSFARSESKEKKEFHREGEKFAAFSLSSKFHSGVEGSLDKASVTASAAKTSLTGEDFAAMSGTLNAESCNLARKFLDNLPLILRNQIRVAAREMVYSILVSDQKDVRDRQYSELSKITGLDTLLAMKNQYSLVRKLGKTARVPLIELSIPYLKTISGDELDQFFKCLEILIIADGKVELFEYIIYRILRQSLTKGKKKGSKNRFSFQQSAVTVLSALAAASHSSPENSMLAYNEGLGCLAMPAREKFS